MLVKLKKIGTEGRIYRWIKYFLSNRKIQERINNKYPECLTVDTGVPLGSVNSPISFSIMINDIYKSLDSTIGKSLFADDGALWKRGRNISHVVKSLQNAINKVQLWASSWGFRFSVEKKKVIFFTQKKVGEEVKFKLYDRELERVQVVSFFLGMWFDKRLGRYTYGK